MRRCRPTTEVSRSRPPHHSNRGLGSAEPLRLHLRLFRVQFLPLPWTGDPIISPKDRARGAYVVELSQEGSGPGWGWSANTAQAAGGMVLGASPSCPRWAGPRGRRRRVTMQGGWLTRRRGRRLRRAGGRCRYPTPKYRCAHALHPHGSNKIAHAHRSATHRSA